MTSLSCDLAPCPECGTGYPNPADLQGLAAGAKTFDEWQCLNCLHVYPR